MKKGLIFPVVGRKIAETFGQKMGNWDFWGFTTKDFCNKVFVILAGIFFFRLFSNYSGGPFFTVEQQTSSAFFWFVFCSWMDQASMYSVVVLLYTGVSGAVCYTP